MRNRFTSGSNDQTSTNRAPRRYAASATARVISSLPGSESTETIWSGWTFAAKPTTSSASSSTGGWKSSTAGRAYRRVLCAGCSLEQVGEDVVDKALERGRQQAVGADEVAEVHDVGPPLVDAIGEVGAARLHEGRQLVQVPAGVRPGRGRLTLGLCVWLLNDRDRLRPGLGVWTVGRRGLVDARPAQRRLAVHQIGLAAGERLLALAELVDLPPALALHPVERLLLQRLPCALELRLALVELARLRRERLAVLTLAAGELGLEL